MNLVSKVEKEIQAERLLRRGDKMVVAVSGGPDSMALLHVLFALSKRWDWRLVVAHVDHGFRVEESALEAAMVEEEAARLGLACEVGRFDAPGYIRETGQNAQAAARELRYGFLQQTAAKSGAERIVLAHHADDQAETMLMRLLRGTGPAGLSGIPVRRTERNVELVRPLLRIYKSELLDYCREEGIRYCIDSSNESTKYTRNEIRLELLPMLQRYNEQLPQALGRLSVMMAAENDFVDRQAAALFEQCVAAESDFAEWSRNWFAGVHVALQRRLIKLILNYLSFDADSMDFLKLEQMRDAILRPEPSNLHIDIGQSLVLTREYDRIKLHTLFVPPIPYRYVLQRNERRLTITETGAVIECAWFEGDAAVAAMKALPADGRDAAWFDAGQLTFPLTVRSRADGDRMTLFGLNGSKKVKDIFIDAKIPPSRRTQIPVVADDRGRVVWLPGVRRSSHALVSAATQAAVYMRLCTPEADASSVLR
ncbi:tRNA(Ile)-lysidine synthase [Paenibacillus konkukensis]|uniref:tRNA(Ile)-lysidine synthase n=1 Tax=Paenibacillus konkukensis TaxID=2020716 RepID=A0ABY4RRX1_9BACL|nr:tRNA lysidine(34) synthetase TilS [Paenibacillus konkukensis]UQZ84923.1 tRNA(Ile)-lysidine synthase [Paenibacillus konkukensis]